LATESRGALQLLAFPETSRFAFKPSQVVKLGPANPARTHKVNVIDYRGVDGENALDSLAEADLANCDGLAQSGVVASDYSAFERLQPLFVTFPDTNMDSDRIARPELRMSPSTSVLAYKSADKSVLHD